MDQPRRRGRPNVFEALGLTMEEIQAVVDKAPNLHVAAERLGVGQRTLVRLRCAKKKSAVPTSHVKSAAESALGMRTDLEPPMKAVAAKFGCSTDALSRALKKRANRVRVEVEALGDFRSVIRTLLDEKGRRVWTSFIQSYTLAIDPWKLNVLLTCQLPIGPTHISVNWKIYKSWFTEPKSPT